MAEPGATIVRRRRGRLLEEQILSAAWAELTELGWSRFRVDSVAERAGASKASMYRRWPNRAALVMAASRLAAATVDEAPQRTGHLRTDLLAALRTVATFMVGPFGEAARGIVAEAALLGDQADSWGETRIQLVQATIAGADDGGPELAARLSPRILRLGPELVAHHCLVHGDVPDDDEIAGIVDEVWLPLIRLP